MTDAVWTGWWVVRWGRRLVHIEADDAEDAIRGSIEALRGMGDWTEDPGELCAFLYVEYGKHAGKMEFTRAVIDRGAATAARVGAMEGAGEGPDAVGCDTGARDCGAVRSGRGRRGHTCAE